jgi:hypothetical protein
MPAKHTTYDYHRYGSPDLMTELTICESFASSDSPYMVALKNPVPYGAMIGDFLLKNGLMHEGTRLMEAGGGYGTLMKCLLPAHSTLINSVYMTDLSMHMLKKQKETLKEWGSLIHFVQADILAFLESILNIDLIIINEVIGDLEVITDMDVKNLPDDISELVKEYNLEIPASGRFNFNIGAVRLIKAISKKNISAFVTEHSSDPIIPDNMQFLEEGLALNSFPREVRLYKHSEYTIRFSHLVKTAEAFGRYVLTGPLIDLVGLKNTPDIKFIFTNHITNTERQGIIYELLDHIREYRWLLIM